MATPKPIETDTGGQEVFARAPSGASLAAELQGLSTVAGAPYEQLGKLGGELADVGTKLLEPEMAARGTQAVTRDPGTGELSVQLRTPLNDLDIAYNHAAKAAFAAQSAGDTRLALQKMAIDNADDPDKFRTLATTYVKTLAGGKGVPNELRGDILNTGIEDITQFTGSLVAKKQADDTKNQLVELKSNIERGWNDVFALAHNGGTQTPDFQSALAKVKNQYAALQNPVFGVTPQQIDDEISQKMGAAEGEATLGQAVAQAKEHGVAAGEDFVNKAIWDPSLNLTPAQRDSFASRGKREIGEWDAQQRDAATELKQIVDNRLDDARARAEATGKWEDVVSPDEIANAYRKDPAKAADILSDLNARATTFSMRKQVLNASPADLAAMNDRYNPANSAPPKGGWDRFYSGFLAPHEAGYVANDGNGSPTNFGVNQKADGVDVSKLTPATAAKILHDKYWLASGADNMPADLAAVHGDTAVNMGLGAAKDLLAQSGGDVSKYLALREARYRSIAANNPDKAKNLPGWLERNEDLRNFTSGGGFADQQKTYQAFIQAVHERNTQLTKDPAAYAAAARPDIAAYLQSNDPMAIQMGVRGLIQAQRDFGVTAPRILSDGQASQIVQGFNNPQDPNKPADHMNQMIDGLAQRLGSYFPQAMTELQAKGMPPEASALYQVRGMGVQAARMATAINSMSHMGKNLNEGRDAFFTNAPNNSEIGKAIPGVMSDLAQTFVGNPTGPQSLQATDYAVRLYARQLAYEGVSDPNKAAQQAHDDLVGSRYNFVDSYRVPKGIDQSMIQAGANTLKRTLPAAGMEPYANAGPGVSQDDRRAMSARILSGQGVWVTRSDDKGLSLVWPQQTGFLPALDAKGKPLTFSWAALQAAAQPKNKLPYGGSSAAALEAGAYN